MGTTLGSRISGGCPADDVLLAFSLGRLADADLAPLGAHLDGCAACEARLTALEGHSDEIIQGLQQRRGPVVDFQPGELVGEYEIVGLIGSGGMARVWQARHRRMNRTVALKVAAGARFNDRFQREVEVLAKLTHPNIATAFDAGDRDGSPYLVMEFLEGVDLQKRLADGPLPVAAALDYTLQAARGLAYAHAHGLVHRDVKPANLFLTTDGTVKLLDLGLVRRGDEVDAAPTPSPGQRDTRLTSATTVMGTLDFAAPEQLASAATADQRADVYSLGGTLYALLAGHSPFTRTTVAETVQAHREEVPPLRQVRPDVPARLAKLAAAMLAPDPARRPPSMAVVIQELEALRAGPGWWKWLAGVAALLILGLGVAFAWPRRPPEPLATPVEPTVATARQAAWAKYRGEAVGVANSVGQVMILIPPGDDLAQPLRAAKTETTVGQFRKFVAATNYLPDGLRLLGGWHPNPKAGEPGASRFVERKEWRWDAPGFDKPQSEDHPVVQVSWTDAQAFCQWLGEQEGCRYRLPTQAEHRWLTFAGAGTKYPFGDDVKRLVDYAWFDANSNARTNAVARLAPNVWGLHDTLGNVCEWVMDTWPDGPRSKQAAPGSYLSKPADLLNPQGWLVDKGVSFLGFRVVRELTP